MQVRLLMERAEKKFCFLGAATYVRTTRVDETPGGSRLCMGHVRQRGRASSPKVARVGCVFGFEPPNTNAAPSVWCVMSSPTTRSKTRVVNNIYLFLSN
jgi:hypothetical protein